MDISQTDADDDDDDDDDDVLRTGLLEGASVVWRRHLNNYRPYTSSYTDHIPQTLISKLLFKPTGLYHSAYMYYLYIYIYIAL